LKRVVKGDEFCIDGKAYPVMNPKEGNYEVILRRNYEQMHNMLSYHSRIIVIRLDLHLHDYSTSSDLISNFIRKLRKTLVRKYKFKRMGYMWVREWESIKMLTQSQHYHLALILDANVVRHPAAVIKAIECIWQGWGLPKPYTPKNCYSTAFRDDPNSFIKPFKRLSYMAKVGGKGNRGKAANDYSSSQIRAKKC